MPCSACGLSKRHLFDDAARRGGYDAVATGHNLDDEAAVLFGNVLRWQVEYLGRQLPVLPERAGFPRKVKPLVRLSERETAAWCVLRGIDYVVEECPMAVGQQAPRLQGGPQRDRGGEPRQQARLLLRVPRPRPRSASRGTAQEDGGSGVVRAMRRADHRRSVCAFCRLVERTAGAEPVPFTGRAGRRRR